VRAPRRPRSGGNAVGRILLHGLLGTLAFGFLGLFVLVPITLVFVEAFARGVAPYLAALRQPDALAALKLTVTAAAIAVPLNTAFGIAVAWAVTKFRFPGRGLLVTLVELPLSVSPVISGMTFVLLFGRNGWLGPFLAAHDLKIVFAVPGIVLATVFVTFPLVAREIIPVMQAQGTDEEEAARVLGAGGWTIFRRVTLPGLKWGLLYGAILCNARAMGEFGAVSVVSGHIRGRTNTLPLHVEALYNEYDTQGAFAVASLLVMLAAVTLVMRTVADWRAGREAAREMDDVQEAA
jgi:sulfate transport system permease protein